MSWNIFLINFWKILTEIQLKINWVSRIISNNIESNFIQYFSISVYKLCFNANYFNLLRKIMVIWFICRLSIQLNDRFLSTAHYNYNLYKNLANLWCKSVRENVRTNLQITMIHHKIIDVVLHTLSIDKLSRKRTQKFCAIIRYYLKKIYKNFVHYSKLGRRSTQWICEFIQNYVEVHKSFVSSFKIV